MTYLGKPSSSGTSLERAWAMDGFQSIIVRGLGLSTVLLPVVILVAYAAGCFALASWKFWAESNTSDG